MIEINAPGAGKTPGSGFGTQVEDINLKGAITGTYADANNVMHGFLRTRQGRVITFDVPGAGTATDRHEGTLGLAINAAGEITGAYFDSNYVLQGFLLLTGRPQF